MTTNTLKRDFKSWCLLFFLGFIWGFSFLAVSISLESFSPIQVAAWRIIIGAFVVLVFCLAIGEGLPKINSAGRSIWPYCAGMALLSNVIPFCLLSWALLHVTSSFAGITMTMVPLAVLPLAHIFGKGDYMTPRKVTGFLIGFAGVLFLFEPSEILNFSFHESTILAKMLCLLATLCYATGSIITRRSPQTVSSLSFSAGALLLAALIIAPISFIFSDLATVITFRSVIGVLFLGFLPTGIATIILVYLVKNSGPSFMSLVNYQVPIWAVLFGVFFNQEKLPASAFLALLLILFGLFFSQYKRNNLGVLR